MNQNGWKYVQSGEWKLTETMNNVMKNFMVTENNKNENQIDTIILIHNDLNISFTNY